MLAGHRSEGLLLSLTIVPGNNPACDDKQSLTGFGLEAPHSAQVIQIVCKQRAMGLGYLSARGGKPLGRNAKGVSDCRASGNAGRGCRQAAQKPIDYCLTVLLSWHCEPRNR
jgi:hypothetical protein